MFAAWQHHASGIQLAALYSTWHFGVGSQLGQVCLVYNKNKNIMCAGKFSCYFSVLLLIGLSLCELDNMLGQLVRRATKETKGLQYTTEGYCINFFLLGGGVGGGGGVLYV